MQIPPSTSSLPLEKIEALRNNIVDLFVVFDTTLDQPHPGHVRFRGRFLQDTADCFDDLRARFEEQGFTPMIRQEEDRVALIALPTVFNPPASNWWVNLVLFVLTVISTLFVGSSYGASSAQEALMLWRGWEFSLSIMLILGAHELGHYFAARYHKVPVTLPYFIPLPFISLIGTLGAFIRLKAPVKNRRALLDVGVAGPLAGMVFALPIIFYGLATSEVSVITPPPPGEQILLEGNSILYLLIKYVVFGQILPTGGVGGMDVQLNSVAWAGWVGLLVTALNLIPVGQLDGGHVAYVLFGKNARQLFWPVIIILAGLILFTGSTMWVLWIGMLFFFGRAYAEPLDDITPLDKRRKVVAILTLILFVLIFSPIPFQYIS